MDGHPRQNPAYRPATEKALATGLFLWTRFAGDSSSDSPRGGLTAVSVEPLGAVAQRGLEGSVGYEPLRQIKGNTRGPAPPVPLGYRRLVLCWLVVFPGGSGPLSDC